MRQTNRLRFLFGITFEYYRDYWDSWLVRWKFLPWVFMIASSYFLIYPCSKISLRHLFNGISCWLFFYHLCFLIIKYFPLHTGSLFPLISRNLFGIYLWHDPLNYVAIYWVDRYKWLSHPLGIWSMYLLRFAGIFILSLALNETFKNVAAYLRCKLHPHDARQETFPIKNIMVLLLMILCFASYCHIFSFYSMKFYQGIFYITDPICWERGYWRKSGGFYVKNDPTNAERYKLGYSIILPDKTSRKIVKIHKNGKYINVFTEGKNFVTKYYPHELKVIPSVGNDNYYLTDLNWSKGYRRGGGGFFVPPTAENIAKFKVGRFVILPDGSPRKITATTKNPSYLNVFTDGAHFTTPLQPHELTVRDSLAVKSK